MHKVVTTNTHIWCWLDEVIDIVFVRHSSVIKNGVCTFGGKWVENLFCIKIQNNFSVNYNGDLKVECWPIHYNLFFSFSHLNSPSYVPHL